MTAALLAVYATSQAVYLDSGQPMSRRVDDLVARMTLEEKIGQMMHQAAAIPRLGIRAYDWWNESLHGITRPGNVTVFPQSIGLAATFDDELVRQIGDAISTEARARYNYEKSNGSQGWNQGLDFWAPNINIFRDPRWGRGQETYGEDPFLTSRMGVAYVRGMQGDDVAHLKTIATPKHYAVHSGPDSLRHTMDTRVTPRDMWLTYLPAFQASITEGRAWSVMSAYNRVNGEPCSASPTLLKKILRERWRFPGYVVSDCGAIWDIVNGHKVAATAEEAAALAVNNGCDLECGDAYRALQGAVQKKLIRETQIDISVKRLMEARMRLGMFDKSTRYDSIGMSEVDSERNRRLALRAARESVVLLANSKGFLPLNKKLRSIAVIGPNADSKTALYGNYHGNNSKMTTVLQGIKNTVSQQTQVYYAKGTGIESASDLQPIPIENLEISGEYFANRDLLGPPALIRKDAQIDFDWGDASPAAQIPKDDFSVRWNGALTALKSGRYRIAITCDDGMRLYIDGKKILEDWTEHAAKTTTAEIDLQAGRKYQLKVEYYDRGGQAVSKLSWSLPEQQPFADALAAARKSDVVVMVLGIDTSVEDEDRDRTYIGLPSIQEELLKTIYATGKPVVLVLMNGGPISSPWSASNIPSIVEAWYPGEEGGRAVADVLFGNYNPGGRLPVTVVRSLSDLPGFENYDMAGRTYRYATRQPLYRFGYGLSYTTFSLSNLMAPSTIRTGEPLKISVKVWNSGKMDGDEVLQVYVRHKNAGYKMPNLQLCAFKRISLAAKRAKNVTVEIPADRIAILRDDTRLWSQAGELEVFLGDSSDTTKAVHRTVRVIGPAKMVK